MAEAASVKHYSSTQSILVVGRGDFSFSRSLATAFCSGKNLVSTSLDSYEELSSKYTEAELNITILNAMGATILHGVDAKTMKHHFALNMRRFDRIVFNFPHAGFNGKRENDVSLIESHKHLVRGFFDNARHLFGPYGEIHVSHKIGLPYDEWNIEQLASESSLIMVEINFNIQDYPGYNNKRGDGIRCNEPFPYFKFSRDLNSLTRYTLRRREKRSFKQDLFNYSRKSIYVPWSTSLGARHLCPIWNIGK